MSGTNTGASAALPASKVPQNHGGFYFVCVMRVCREFSFAKRYDFERNLCFALTWQQLAPKIVPFSVSVLAVVTNKVDTPTSDKKPGAERRAPDSSFPRATRLAGSPARSDASCKICAAHIKQCSTTQHNPANMISRHKQRQHNYDIEITR